MAPEQADLGTVADASWDVYALGSLLYCMLTGSPAHRSDSTINYIESASELSEQLARYRTSLHQSPAPEAHRRVPGVDRALADIVDKCLALHPSDRYPNVFAVLQALESRAQVRHRRPLWILGLVGPLATVSEVHIPSELVAPGTEYEYEVLAIEVSGNKTISAGEFETAEDE